MPVLWLSSLSIWIQEAFYMAIKTPQGDSGCSFSAEDRTRVLWTENLLKGIVLLVLVSLTCGLIACLAHRLWPHVVLLIQALR